MEYYDMRYREEVWPDCWDDVDKRVWFCKRCHQHFPTQEDGRCPISLCDGELEETRPLEDDGLAAWE
jgi:hypothetical protein